MRYCEKCKVKIGNPRERCPLCQGELIKTEDLAESETFPYIPTFYKSNPVFFRTLLFLSVVCCVTCIGINLAFPVDTWWSFIVLLGILYMWAGVYAGLRGKRIGIGKRILQQVVVLAVALICVDVLTGFYRWSFDYVIPILFMSALLAIMISSKLMGIPLQFFAIYLLIDAVLGIIPLVFILTGLCLTPEPSFICVVISVLSFASVFIYADKNTASELRRRFHL